MSLTDRMNGYVLVRRNTITQLNVSWMKEKTHDRSLLPEEKYFKTRFHQVAESVTTNSRADISGTIIPSSPNCQPDSVEQTGRGRSLKGLRLSFIHRAIALEKKELNIKVQENSPASLSNLLTAGGSTNPKKFLPSRTGATWKTASSQQYKMPDSGATAVKSCNTMQAQDFSVLPTENCAQRKLKPGILDQRFVTQRMSLKIGTRLCSPAKQLAESPKVAPHPGDKDIPLVTNHVGLLESLVETTSSYLFLSKATMNDPKASCAGSLIRRQSKESNFLAQGVTHRRMRSVVEDPTSEVWKPRKAQVWLNSSLRPRASKIRPGFTSALPQ